jgi:hypothetical protein
MKIRSIKAGFISAAVISTFVGVSALAQTESATSTSSTATEEAGEGASSSSSMSASPAGTEAVSTLNLKDEKGNASPRRLKGELYNETHFAKANFNNHEGVTTTKDFLGVYYKTADHESVSLRQTFSFASPKERETIHYTTGDIYGQYLNSKVANFLGDGTITTISRLYVPTGEASRFTTQRMGAARQYIIASKSVGKFDYNYLALGDYYNWTKDAYQSPTDGSWKQNDEWYAAHEFDVNYNVTKWFAIDQELGTETLRHRPLPGNPDYLENVNILTTLTFTITPDINIQTILEDDINIYNPTQGFKVWRDNELEAIMLFTARI